QKRGARLIVIDPRSTPLARTADQHLAVRPGTDVALALALHRYLFVNGLADEAFLREHTRGADRLRERAEEWPIARAVEGRGGRGPRAVRRVVRTGVAGADPLRLGARAEQKRGQWGAGGARAAGGRRQVRRARRRVCDEQFGFLGHRSDLDRIAGPPDPPGQ